MITCPWSLLRSQGSVGRFVLESIRSLFLTENCHHDRVGSHVPGLARVVPAVIHRHIVDSQGGSCLILAKRNQVNFLQKESCLSNYRLKKMHVMIRLNNQIVLKLFKSKVWKLNSIWKVFVILNNKHIHNGSSLYYDVHFMKIIEFAASILEKKKYIFNTLYFSSSSHLISY